MTASSNKFRRLVIVSNRLPVSLKQDEAGAWTAHRSSGGLVSALDPVLRKWGGLWIGWPGITGTVPHLNRILAGSSKEAGYQIIPVPLAEEEKNQFYYGYSNEVIWPLFHDLQTLCNFDPTYWITYAAVNARFGQSIRDNCDKYDFVWVHDYQLMDVAQSLRQHGFKNRMAFFLHIPFPPVDIFLKLPQQQRLLHDLLQYDLLGFQSGRDRYNFIECVRRLVKSARIQPTKRYYDIELHGRRVRVGRFPIGIDFEQYRRRAMEDGAVARLHEIRQGLAGQQIILGVDRLDYTKGIPDRLKAYREALTRYPDLRGKTTFVQVVVPSREDLPRYNDLRVEIEQLVGNINGQFSVGNWTPINYFFRALDPQELIAYYRAASIALITPHKDGMNLVAKEFCACNVEGQAVLILSQFAGAAEQLKRGALLINPYDVEQTADAIHQAFLMNAVERKERMRKLRKLVRKENIFWWVDQFIDAAHTTG